MDFKDTTNSIRLTQNEIYGIELQSDTNECDYLIVIFKELRGPTLVFIVIEDIRDVYVPGEFFHLDENLIQYVKPLDLVSKSILNFDRTLLHILRNQLNLGNT